MLKLSLPVKGGFVNLVFIGAAPGDFGKKRIRIFYETTSIESSRNLEYYQILIYNNPIPTMKFSPGFQR